MFRNFGSFSAILKQRHFTASSVNAGVRQFSSAAATQTQQQATKSRPEGFPWRLVAAVCVIRFPTVSLEKIELEKRYEEMRTQETTERSVLSEYELEQRRRAKEQREYEERVAGEEEIDFESERRRAEQQSRHEEADELHELEEQELKSFEPAGCETECDVQNDRRSSNRRLRDTLYLLVKKQRSENAWQMPQGGHDGTESMRQTAERELREECGSHLVVKFTSNLPCNFFAYKFPAEQKSWDETIGAKVFFFKAYYESGQVEINREELEDFAWVTKDEMRDYVSSDYYSNVVKFLSS